MRRVLLMSYFFPPLGGANALRLTHLVRHLPEHGWLPSVLATKSGHYDIRDPGLADLLPGEIEIHRVRAPEPERIYRCLRRWWSEDSSVAAAPDSRAGGTGGTAFLEVAKRFARRWILIPDEKLLWSARAAPTARSILERERPDAFIAAQPNSTLLAAAWAARREGVPFLPDFQDEWSRRAVGPEKPFPRDRLEVLLESACLAASTKVLCNTPRMRDHFLRRTGRPAREFPVLRNGWDPEGFPADAACRRRPSSLRVRAAGPVVEAVFAGALYGRYRPEGFLRGWGRAVAEKRLPREALRVTFYGSHERAARRVLEDILDEAGLRDQARFPGLVPRTQIVERLLEADFLVLSLPDLEGSDSWIPLRTCEFLATGRPLLAEVPPGDAKDLIRACGGASVIAPGDSEEAAGAVVELHAALTGGGVELHRDWGLLDQLTWPSLAARLARILDATVGRGSVPEDPLARIPEASSRAGLEEAS